MTTPLIAQLIESDVLDRDDDRLRREIDDAMVRVRRWQQEHPKKLLPGEAVAVLAISERNNARRRVDRRRERQLALQERLVLHKLGGQISDEEVERELTRLLAARLSRMDAQGLLQLAQAKQAEEQAELLRKEDDAGEAS